MAAQAGQHGVGHALLLGAVCAKRLAQLVIAALAALGKRLGRDIVLGQDGLASLIHEVVAL